MDAQTPAATFPGIVLVVDDDAAVRNAIAFALEAEGYASRVFPAGLDLLAEAEFPGHGCIVADDRLPDLNGLDLISELRRRGVRLPAILIASAPGRRLRAHAERDGVPIVEKPLLDNALVQAIRNALGLPPAA